MNWKRKREKLTTLKRNHNDKYLEMFLSDLSSKYTKKELRHGPARNRKTLMNKYPGRGHEPHTDYFYGFLGLIYDGVNHIDVLKEKMRLFFISSTRQLVVEETDVEEYLQVAKRNDLVIVNEDGIITLTEKGKKLTESCYHINTHTSYYMRIFFSEKTVMIGTAIFLVVLSALKIVLGIQLASQGMITEGFENLTDLVKIGIIGIVSLKLKKDRPASLMIIFLMLITGVTMVWSGIEALFNQTPITPTVQSYLLGFTSMSINAGFMFLKGIVGRNSGNLSLLSDSKDSELNVKISFGVIIGLTFAIFDYYFVDALVAIVIAIIIFKEGIEILYELLAKKEDFDITEIRVAGDSIYLNRLTVYIFASIRRESITRSKLLYNFELGLELGRRYYQGFADFFYNDLGKKIAEKHLNKLIKDQYIEEINGELILTSKGLKSFYEAKAKEFRFRAKKAYEGVNIRKGQMYCLIFIIILVLLIVFADNINTWLISF
ncbi:MAG: cation transporter [Promethearchaeota archaeon]